jgi:hypothetical protein
LYLRGYKEKKKMANLPGYCKLCRAKEIELYGMVLHNSGKRHSEAMRLAGCKHPIAYRQDKGKLVVVK